MKQDLRIKKSSNPNVYRNVAAYWRESEPFVENKYGMLLHRPREITTYNTLKSGPHIAVHYWCGMTQTGSKKFTFLPHAPENRIVCARCEKAAVDSGLQTSSEISGRHICIGGIKAFSICHPERSHD